jgi:hypothetical protein
MQKQTRTKQLDNFAELQPHIEITYTQILTEIQTQSYKDPLWKIWLSMTKAYFN